MHLSFVKYHGTGNDFILIDDRENRFVESTVLIAQLCDRHLGIGADGILILRNSLGYDFEMVYYNSDGSTATFCGNGGRCIVAFALKLGIISKSCLFKAPDGEHSASILSNSDCEVVVSLQMRDAVIYQNSPDFTYLNSGTFHYVEFVDNAESFDLVPYARKIRYDETYAPHGTNVNLVTIHGKNLFVRTYEKGVEDETLSCGTGVTASAIAASLRNGGNEWFVRTKGGNLEVRFERKVDYFTNIFLLGPATLVFEGFTSI
jgi:diaminopimelate epimerase